MKKHKSILRKAEIESVELEEEPGSSLELACKLGIDLEESDPFTVAAYSVCSKEGIDPDDFFEWLELYEMVREDHFLYAFKNAINKGFDGDSSAEDRANNKMEICKHVGMNDDTSFGDIENMSYSEYLELF